MASRSDNLTVTQVSDEEFLTLGAASPEPMPIEQAPVWDGYDNALRSRTPWRRLAVRDGDTTVAIVAATEYEGRHFRYLWARHAPVWLAEPSAELEQAAHAAIASYVAEHAPHIDFVRLHAHERGPHLQPLLQTVTYDRTVVIDLSVPADEYLAGLAKKFRYTVRQALKHENVAIADESGLEAAAFDELYEIYRETAARDGFGIYSADAYFSLVKTLAPHARVYVARRTDGGPSGERPGRAVAWAIVTVFDGAAQYYYAAANAEARATDATVRLLWETLELLRGEGVRTFDMMGVDSELAPTLAGVGLFKRKWGEESVVHPAWDLPVKPLRFALLRLGLATKRLFGR